MLNYPASLGESDVGDCYDRQAHPLTSIALQSWATSITIRVLLTALQTMRFCLRTGFGESTGTYGGTIELPLAGPGQGNVGAPPLFAALSALIVNAYRRMGHGAKLTSSYMNQMFLIAAVMYVDDTDLLHWAPSITTTTNEELIEQVQ